MSIGVVVAISSGTCASSQLSPNAAQWLNDAHAHTDTGETMAPWRLHGRPHSLTRHDTQLCSMVGNSARSRHTHEHKHTLRPRQRTLSFSAMWMCPTKLGLQIWHATTSRGACDAWRGSDGKPHAA